MSDDDVRRQVDDSPVVEMPMSGRLKAISAEEFLALTIPPREFLLEPWLPSQGAVMVYSWRGVGKTYFGLGVAYAVASAGRFLKWEAPKARRVLYIDGEMPAVVMQERMAGIAASSEKSPPKGFLRLITPDLQEVGIPDLSDPAAQAEVDQLLAGAELLILDNISTLFRTGAENEAESWLPTQEWVLRQRRRGVSTMLMHHAGKGGQQRGTSRREDILDTTIRLDRPSDYQPTEGARFEVHFDKARGLYGDETKSFEAQMETRDGEVFWTTKDMDKRTTERVAACLNEGLTPRETAKELGVHPSTISRQRKKAVEAGLIDGAMEK